MSFEGEIVVVFFEEKWILWCDQVDFFPLSLLVFGCVLVGYIED